MQVLRTWFAGRIPHVFEGGDNIWRVKRFTSSSFFFSNSAHLNARKRTGYRLGVNFSDKTDIPDYFPSFLFVLPGFEPFRQMFSIDVVFSGHIHMITMVTELVSTR